MWIIIKTKFSKEHYVASQIRNAGFDAWHPVQVIARRPAIARRVTQKAQLRAYREIAILPRRLFMRVNDDLHFPFDFAAPRHMVGIETNADMEAVLIPDRQIDAFRAVIDAENTAALALSQSASKRQRAKWKNLHDALVEMIEGAKAQLEQAA